MSHYLIEFGIPSVCFKSSSELGVSGLASRSSSFQEDGATVRKPRYPLGILNSEIEELFSGLEAQSRGSFDIEQYHATCGAFEEK